MGFLYIVYCKLDNIVEKKMNVKTMARKNFHRLKFEYSINKIVGDEFNVTKNPFKRSYHAACQSNVLQRL
jgi:hypothetical protein